MTVDSLNISRVGCSVMFNSNGLAAGQNVPYALAETHMGLG